MRNACKIGVGDDEFDVLHARVNHAIDRVIAAAPDTNHLDASIVASFFVKADAESVVFHTSPRKISSQLQVLNSQYDDPVRHIVLSETKTVLCSPGCTTPERTTVSQTPLPRRKLQFNFYAPLRANNAFIREPRVWLLQTACQPGAMAVIHHAQTRSRTPAPP